MYVHSLAIFRQCKAIGSINCHIYPINKYLILLTLVMDSYKWDVLNWLPFPQCISYRIASLVWRCLSGWSPFYLCRRVLFLWCPTTWNGLPPDLRHLPNGARSQFHCLLKTVVFHWVWSASE